MTAAPVSPSQPRGSRRTGRIVVGLVILVAGVLAGLALLLLRGSQYEESVKNLARAPLGCTTALDFTEVGTFTVYVETKGTLEVAGGDCDNDGDYIYEDDDLPRVELTLIDADGDEVDFERDASGSYDVGDFAGEAIRTFEVEEPGTFRLRVESRSEDFAIAIGRQPEEDTKTLSLIGVAAIAIGVLLGVLLLLTGLRRRPSSDVPSPHVQFSQPGPGVGVPGVAWQAPPPVGEAAWPGATAPSGPVPGGPVPGGPVLGGPVPGGPVPGGEVSGGEVSGPPPWQPPSAG